MKKILVIHTLWKDNNSTWGLLLVFFYALFTGAYDSRHRMLIRRIAELLEIPWDEVEDYEKAIVLSLRQEKYQQTE